MYPIQLNTQMFNDDQTPLYQATYWDTTMTVAQQGIGFTAFDLTQATFNLLLSSYATQATLEAALNNTSIMKSALGYRSGSYVVGVEPNLIRYWGAGAPPGCSTPKRALVKYSGRVVAPDATPRAVTLVFGGQGKLRVFKNGTELRNGTLREAIPNPDLTTKANIERDAGYLIIETTVTQNDLIEVYLAHNNDPWGGIVGKVFAGTVDYTNPLTAWTLFRTALRDAPVISASFLSLGAVTPRSIPYIESADLSRGPNEMPQLSLVVGLNEDNAPNGFFLQNVGGQNQLTDNADATLIIKAGRRIYFEGGFKMNSPASANLILQSEFATLAGAWTGGAPTGYTLSAATAPDGSTTAMTWAGAGRFWQESGAAVNGPYAASLNIRAVSGTPTVTLMIKDRATDTVRGTATKVAGATWQQMSAFGTTAGASAGFRYEFTVTGGTVAFEGAQIEVGSIVTPLIKTTTGAVSRPATEIYPRLLGSVVSITPDTTGESATILCGGFEKRMETTDENYPDRLSNVSAGFINKEWLGYPVFGISAFDAWPLESALACLCDRVGIDPYYLGKAVFDSTIGQAKYRRSAAGTLALGTKRFYARSLSDTTEYVTLQRNTNYGNVGTLKKEYLPNDDTYLYPSAVSDRVWDRASLIANQFGYDFFFDAEGMAVIGPRNNPQSFQYISGGSQLVSPAAVGGKYDQERVGLTGTGWSRTIDISASRADLYVGLGPDLNTGLNGGVFQVAVAQKDAVSGTYVNVPTATKVISTYLAGTTPVVARNSTATYFDSTGKLQTAAINVLRTLNYTGGVQKTLIEEASTNFIKNNTATGAGTNVLPTTWTTQLGTNTLAVATTTDTKYPGFTGVRITLTNATAGTVLSNIYFSGQTTNGNAAVVNQIRTISAVMALISGTPTMQFGYHMWDSAGGYLGNADGAQTLTATLTRVTKTVTITAATTAFVTPRLTVNVPANSSTAVDIYLPQDEVSAFMTSIIPTTNAPATRAADIVSYPDVKESFYYDNILKTDGTNAAAVTLFQLPFDDYRLTITPVGPDLADSAGSALVRMNGLAVFEKNPSANCLPSVLSTLDNLMDLKPESQEKDLRNHVIVVGQRKAAVSDSAKFNDEDNPNNPYTEFFVSVSSDVASQFDPQAANFVGGKRASVIVDDKVADQDFANWLSRTLLYRQNHPNLAANITYTVLPVLELRDPIQIKEERDNSFKHLVWVQSFRERWTTESADVEIECIAYPELPSYTPREDVDIAPYQYAPAAKLAVGYKNVMGDIVSNPNPTSLPVVGAGTMTGLAAGANTLPVGGFLESAYLTAGLVQNPLAQKPWLNYMVNHPYRHFWHRTGKTGTGATTQQQFTFDFQEGDGTAGVYDQAAYGFPTGYKFQYEAFVARTGLNPFYDPYTSEVNNLVTVSFDTLISGFYRVSLWAVSPSGEFDFPVAYLTKPEGDPEDEYAHLQYIEAGTNRQFTWDGTDTVGLWNRYQSRDFARQMEGSFDTKPVSVGRGFYLWNDQKTDDQTQIGDNVAANFGSDGQPYFTKGQYTKLYVKVEAVSDRLLRKNSNNDVFLVDSNVNKKTLPSQFYIFTHLGEPSQVTVTLEDWADPSLWFEGTTVSNWVTTDTTAVFKDGKPVRMSFTAVPRRGIQFQNEAGIEDPEKTTVQLFRMAHVKVHTFDQFWTFYGKPWTGDMHKDNLPENNSSNRDAKRLTSRMNADDEHTIEFANEAWVSGKELATTKWVFQPSYFEKDFGGGKESIRYGDYEQLYSLPGYDAKNGGGTSRPDKSFINLAFMNYLFYLSAHTLDRSGRRQWCINPKYIDKSKIVTDTWIAGTFATTPQYATQYERLGADTYLQRSIFVRQWVEPTWKTSGLNGRDHLSTAGFLANSPVDAAHPGTGGIVNAYQLLWVQPNVLDFAPQTSPMASGGALDTWADAYMTRGAGPNIGFWYSASRSVQPATLDTHTHNYRVTGFGNWNFDRYIYAGWFKPSPCLDFHPYWRMPAMPEWATRSPLLVSLEMINGPRTTLMGLGNTYTGENTVNLLESSASCYGSLMRDFAWQQNWFGFAYSDLYNPATQFYRGARCEEDVMALAKEGGIGTEMAQIFDYVKQDTLNRFDMFRGVISRAPYARRQEIRDDDLSWWKPSEGRQSGSAPVTPSGVYLMNLGNYTDYIIGPNTAYQGDEDQNYIHFTQDCNDFYDIRFRSEYLWQSSKYFPVYPNGGQKYWAAKQDITGVPSDGLPTFYDSGAWTGWKDDLTSAQWTADKHLRWVEMFGDIGSTSTKGWGGSPSNQVKVHADGSGAGREFLSGGYGVNTAGAAPTATGKVTFQQYIFGKYSDGNRAFKRANFFTDLFVSQRMRLAVGPRVPETKGLVMNLVLPTRLSK